MLRKTVIRLPANATVFVLEDSATRLEWFDERLGRVNVGYSSTVEDALEKLIDLDRDAFLFLDHDLNWMDAGGRKPGSGVRVAHFVSKNAFAGQGLLKKVLDSFLLTISRKPLFSQREYPYWISCACVLLLAQTAAPLRWG